MFQLMSLPYDASALEPVIDTTTVNTHYGKHHAGYVKKLNNALDGLDDFLQMDLLQVLLDNFDNLPSDRKTGVYNNGWQVYNHNLYWESMSPNGGGEPQGEIGERLKEDFGSFEDFKNELSQAGATQFGSGWAWLSLDQKTKKLVVDKTLNADNPLKDGKTPLIALDVWEHAFYLKYKNLKADYIQAFWDVVNWEEVERKYQEAMKK